MIDANCFYTEGFSLEEVRRLSNAYGIRCFIISSLRARIALAEDANAELASLVEGEPMLWAAITLNPLAVEAEPLVTRKTVAVRAYPGGPRLLEL